MPHKRFPPITILSSAVNAADYNLYKEALLAIDDVSHLENNELLLAIQSQEILEKVANLQGGVEGAFLRPRFSHLKTDGISAPHRLWYFR